MGSSRVNHRKIFTSLSPVVEIDKDDGRVLEQAAGYTLRQTRSA